MTNHIIWLAPLVSVILNFIPFQVPVPFRTEGLSLGSGFIIDNSGIVVTNNHVIEGADEITVILYDQSEYTAKLLGRDPKLDLAVLKFVADNL